MMRRITNTAGSQRFGLRYRPPLILGALAITLIAGLAAAQRFEMVRSTVDGGGAHSFGGNWEVTGTAGQPDSGGPSGGGFELFGGLWFPLPPADCDYDGTVGMEDATKLASCMSGPSPPARLDCPCFDTDRNGTVDLRDFANAQSGFYSN